MVLPQDRRKILQVIERVYKKHHLVRVRFDFGNDTLITYSSEETGDDLWA